MQANPNLKAYISPEAPSAQGVAQAVKEDLGLPYLHLETDYSESDRESLRVRIDAFLEIVGNRK